MDKKLFFFDTHCHLSNEDFNKFELKEIVENAKKSKIAFILNVGYDIETNNKLIYQSKEGKGFFLSAIGIHPNSNDDLNDDSIIWMEKKIIEEKIFAIGEIGLDYYRQDTSVVKQKEFFKKQLLLANKYNLPVLLHIRDAFDDAYEIVKESNISNGVVHCFSGDFEIAKKFIDLGFYISFSGTITFQKSDKIQGAARLIPFDRILAETDSPYLSPSPLRGKMNYPWNVKIIVEKIAFLRNVSVDVATDIIFSNSLKFLSLKNDLKLV
ncbi:MAG: putative metal-dependent hydrolase YcfH [Mycoplasmataceae bacterium]|nr:MAG: putative metal-dependent hydrolase YcfH [Mycoplasmataceae bacterium]